MYTRADKVPKRIEESLKEQGIKNVYLIGNTNVISSTVESSLKSMGIKTVRVSARTAPLVSLKLSVRFNKAEMPQSRIWVLSDDKVSHHLSVPAPASRPNATILFTGSSSIPLKMKRFIAYRKPTIGRAFTIGLNKEARDLLINPKVGIEPIR